MLYLYSIDIERAVPNAQQSSKIKKLLGIYYILVMDIT